MSDSVEQLLYHNSVSLVNVVVGENLIQKLGRLLHMPGNALHLYRSEQASVQRFSQSCLSGFSLRGRSFSLSAYTFRGRRYTRTAPVRCSWSAPTTRYGLKHLRHQSSLVTICFRLIVTTCIHSTRVRVSMRCSWLQQYCVN